MEVNAAESGHTILSISSIAKALGFNGARKSHMHSVSVQNMHAIMPARSPSQIDQCQQQHEEKRRRLRYRSIRKNHGSRIAQGMKPRAVSTDPLECGAAGAQTLGPVPGKRLTGQADDGNEPARVRAVVGGQI